eukprot:CAMPEP_0182500912 /NCGR_PEP_ID=MMETSP1321-20130603/10309_1 /TAXON_ID=91990 /ORGANISM="Bolidomonas sp., Strain RCC1657" /LENGTH=35 /DNA_ID= /DNA_START= /DNA_END= /DNA_ORIENTATION=
MKSGVAPSSVLALFKSALPATRAFTTSRWPPNAAM